MARRCYSLLLRCALPLALAWFLWRGRRDPASRGSLAQCLGLGLQPRDDRPLWLHAASVGEVRSLATLLRALHQAGHRLLLTVGTPTGVAHARLLYADLAAAPVAGHRALVVQAAPWDLPGAVRRFMRASDPCAGVFVETELWPNLLGEACGAGVPLILVSARLSARSLARYLRWAPALMRDAVRCFAAIAAQSEADRARLVRLGASPDAVSVGGSLKAELVLPAGLAGHAAALRAHWAAQRPLWIAGSTHAGEETICLAAQQRLLAEARRRGDVAPLLVLVPRHPRRCGEVAREIAAARLAHARTSQTGVAVAGLEVLLADEMGTLLGWYAAGDAAFVGGSLVPVGGHNLLEPAVLGKPVLAGPHDANAPEVAVRLRDAGALNIVHGADELAAALAELFARPERAHRLGALAEAAATPEHSASRHALELLARLPARH